MNLISKTTLWALILGLAVAAALVTVVRPHPHTLRVIELEPVFITGKSEPPAVEQHTARADAAAVQTRTQQ